MEIGDRRLINVYDGRGGNHWVAGTVEGWDEPNYATFKLDIPHRGRTHYAIPLPNGRHRLRPLNLIAEAARQDDVHAAAKTIQDALRIATGDLASHMLPDDSDWKKISMWERVSRIADWMKAEAFDTFADED